MWRPDEVVQADRRKATVLWILLIISILTYGTYIFLRAEEKRDNPSTSSESSNEIYKFPDVWACMYSFYGCDSQRLEQECAKTMNTTEGGMTTATYHPGGSDEQVVSVTAGLSDMGWCVQFKTSAVTTRVGIKRDRADYLDYIYLDLYWYPGGENDSTTCVAEEGAWQSHSNSIYVYLHEPKTGSVSTGTQVPYTCITNESRSYVSTYMGIGLTEVNGIRDTYAALYYTSSLSSSTITFEMNGTSSEIQRPYAYTSIELKQEENSLQRVKEIDPVNVAEILASVGGFWDLLLIIWPLFFVAAVPTGASLRMRNFKDVVQTAETVKSTIVTRTSFARRSFATEVHEESPRRGRSQASSEVLIRLFDDHGLVAVINGDPLKFFLKRVLHATSLKAGAEEPGLRKLLPANTYLLVVPPRSSATAVAMAVVDCCARGGDASEKVDVEPIAVKVMRAKLSMHQSYALSLAYVEPSDDILAESEVVMDQWSALQSKSPTTSQLVPISVPKPADRPYAGGKAPVPCPSPSV